MVWEEEFIDRTKKTSYSYVITWWDDSPPSFNEDTMTYLMFSPEICPESHKPHWQTYVRWKCQKTISATLKNLDFVTHPYVFAAKGDHGANLKYIEGPWVSKDGKKKKEKNKYFQEFGDRDWETKTYG